MPFPEHAAQMIRDKLDAGRLPRDVNPRMFAGYGDGQHCDGCETPISAAQVEWEFITPEGQTVRFHLGCAALWEADRRRRGWLTPAKTT